MKTDQRMKNGIKVPRAVQNGGATSSQFASVQERRIMKKVAQPEHAYTGCVPYTADDDSDAVPKKKNPPILGYRGHLRHDEDRIGTTFTQGLEVTTNRVLTLSGSKARVADSQPRQVRFVQDKAHRPKQSEIVKAGMSPRSGYDQFDNVSGYGNFVAPPAKGNMSTRSGYGAFDNASGYGAFAAPPRGGLSLRSRYGEFENSSGYGVFGGPPPGPMSSRSGYGAFDNASGYGAFAAPPERGEMSPRSGYGAFENASAYGAFAAPHFDMSPRSGYGQFDNASGYGNFASPPNPMQPADRSDSSYINKYKHPHDHSVNEMVDIKPVGGQRFEHTRPFNSPIRDREEQHHGTNRAIKAETPSDPVLQAKYQQAINRVGGEDAALRLWNSAGQTVWQRYMTRTGLLQAVKRSFEKHERTNRGFMTKSQLKEALRDLACVFTDDQITALFGIHDNQCAGTVPMSDLLLALMENND